MPVSVLRELNQQQLNSVGGKACSHIKGGLLCCIHLLTSRSFEFEISISIYSSPFEKTLLESRPGKYMGKATPVWQLSLSYCCH